MLSTQGTTRSLCIASRGHSKRLGVVEGRGGWALSTHGTKLSLCMIASRGHRMGGGGAVWKHGRESCVPLVPIKELPGTLRIFRACKLVTKQGRMSISTKNGASIYSFGLNHRLLLHSVMKNPQFLMIAPER